MRIKKSAQVFEIGSMAYNGLTFESEKVFSHKSALYMIYIILEIDSEIFLFAKEVIFLGIDDFSQSMKIERGIISIEQLHIIKFDEVEHKKCYPIKSIEDKNFVIIDDVELSYEIKAVET